jgi:hypothetical protein
MIVRSSAQQEGPIVPLAEGRRGVDFFQLMLSRLLGGSA